MIPQEKLNQFVEDFKALATKHNISIYVGRENDNEDGEATFDNVIKIYFKDYDDKILLGTV